MYNVVSRAAQLRHASVKTRNLGAWAAIGMMTLSGPALAAHKLEVNQLEFLAETNVKMFEFKGVASDVQAKIDVQGDILKSVEIHVPVNSIHTGMEIRDRHMRERVFTTADGKTPDIVFSATQGECKAGASTGEEDCSVSGSLAFRGTQKPFQLEVKIKGGEIHGQARINVLDWGVAPDSLKYSGVHVNPKTTISFEARLQ